MKIFYVHIATEDIYTRLWRIEKMLIQFDSDDDLAIEFKRRLKDKGVYLCGANSQLRRIYGHVFDKAIESVIHEDKLDDILQEIGV